MIEKMKQEWHMLSRSIYTGERLEANLRALVAVSIVTAALGLVLTVYDIAKGETIMTLMERNGLSPEDTYYVGDTLGDYEACQLAGIRFIFCKYGCGEVKTPYKAIDSFSELKDLFA